MAEAVTVLGTSKATSLVTEVKVEEFRLVTRLLSGKCEADAYLILSVDGKREGLVADGGCWQKAVVELFYKVQHRLAGETKLTVTQVTLLADGKNSHVWMQLSNGRVADKVHPCNTSAIYLTLCEALELCDIKVVVD